MQNIPNVLQNVYEKKSLIFCLKAKNVAPYSQHVQFQPLKKQRVNTHFTIKIQVIPYHVFPFSFFF